MNPSNPLPLPHRPLCGLCGLCRLRRGRRRASQPVRRLLWLGVILAAWSLPQADAQTLLDGLVEVGSHETLETFLSRLPEYDRGHYVLMYRSRSLQDANFDNPRVLMFTPDAHLVMTFNGDAHQRGFSQLEVMRFDPKTKDFQFQEIEFPAAQASADPVRFSALNPDKCSACHGSPPRPVWDAFPFWPGAYGERYRAALEGRQREGLNAFRRRMDTHPRYRWLLNSDFMANPDTFHSDREQRYGGREFEPATLQLSEALGRLNFDNIVETLVRHPRFLTFRYALLAALNKDCAGPVDAFPASLQSAVDEDYRSFEIATARANARQQEQVAQRLRADLGVEAPGASEQPDAITAFRYVVERWMGIQTSGWTLALEKPSYDFSLPQGSASDVLRDQLLPRLASSDARLLSLARADTTHEDTKYCTYLTHMSRNAMAQSDFLSIGGAGMRAALAPAAQDHGALPRQAVPRLLDACATCHQGGVGPPIPFLQPDVLRQALTTQASPHGVLLDEIKFRLSPRAGFQRMPLGGNPDDGQVRELLDYLTALANQK